MLLSLRKASSPKWDGEEYAGGSRQFCEKSRQQHLILTETATLLKRKDVYFYQKFNAMQSKGSMRDLIYCKKPEFFFFSAMSNLWKENHPLKSCFFYVSLQNKGHEFDIFLNQVYR